ncbi:MAG: hypothetical protein ACRCWG_11685 [Sarcina sp.]
MDYEKEIKKIKLRLINKLEKEKSIDVIQDVEAYLMAIKKSEGFN